MKRLLSGTVAIFVGVLGVGTLAFAGARAPTVKATLATFVVVPGSPAGTTWTLNLWERGMLLGTASGTRGTLTVSVPAEVACKFQADVLRDGRWYSGRNVSLPNCGGSPPPTTTTTTTTTTTPPTSTKGGTKSGGGHKPSTGPPTTTTPSKDPQGATTPATKATKATRVSSSKLAFTGVGPGLSMLALAGAALIVLGTALQLRRPRPNR